MTATASAASPAGAVPVPTAPPGALATCPFCSLLCDDLPLAAGTRQIDPGFCRRAHAALQAHAEVPAGAAVACIDGQPVPLASAIAHASALLGASRQPLFGGLATDVEGARVLFKLAARCGAICDHANGEPLALATRVLHDQGAWQVTLGEVAARSDLVLCVGTDPAARHPRFWQRVGADRAGSPLRRVRFIGLPAEVAAQATATLQALVALPAAGDPALDIGTVPPATGREASGAPGQRAADLFDAVQALALALRGRPVAGLDPAWAALAAELRASAYTTVVWEAGVLPRHGELIAATVQSLVATLNTSTRAGSLALAGGEGAATAQQVHTWLAGLPLRTRLPRTPGGPIVHDPLLHGARRLLDEQGCDALLWVSSLGPLAAPLPADGRALPTIVLGPPALAPRPGDGAAPAVFVAVATPGLQHGGHLFRSDGIVAMPLEAPWAPGDGAAALPSVAQVARALLAAMAPAALATTTGAPA